MKLLVTTDEDGHFHTKPIVGNVVELLEFIKDVQPDHYQDTLDDLDLDLCYVSDYDQNATIDLIKDFCQRGVMEIIDMDAYLPSIPNQ